MVPAPLILLNGYPGVGKSAVASALRKLITDSKFFDNHMLIDPVAALLEREDVGYRDLRKALRTSILDSIATNPVLRQRAIITTYYQETLETREIDLREYFECAERNGRPFVVIILRCSEEENARRIIDGSRRAKSKLTDVKILHEIRENHVVYSFYDDGFKSPDVWEYQMDVEEIEPKEAARRILQLVKTVWGVNIAENG